MRQDATFQFSVWDVSFQTELPLLAAEQVTPSIISMAFTNFVMNDNFIALLEQSSAIEVELVAPALLVNKLDVVKERFSLTGFKAAQEEASNLCKVK